MWGAPRALGAPSLQPQAQSCSRTARVPGGQRSGSAVAQLLPAAPSGSKPCPPQESERAPPEDGTVVTVRALRTSPCTQKWGMFGLVAVTVTGVTRSRRGPLS